MLNFKSIKTQLIIYLLGVAVFLLLKEKDFAFALSFVIAVVGATLADSLIIYLKTRSLRISDSSIITGMIIGYVLSADAGWLKFVMAAGLAILSKHLVRFRKKHIFNPAAFGIFLTLILFGAQTQWKGTYLWYVLLPFVPQPSVSDPQSRR